MRTSSYWFSQVLQRLRTFAALLLLCLVLGWSQPAQAADLDNSQLEQQVMQIIREHPEVILESLQAYQKQQREQIQQAQQAFVQSMKTNPQAVIDESPTTGAAESKILLVEFSDFECPYCAQAHKTLKKFMAKHKDQVTLVYKNFPLISIHAQALPAAQAAWAAQKQGKFWEYEDALFTHQKQLGEALYLKIANNLNLDVEKFNGDRPFAVAAIGKDIELAQKLGLSGTPLFVMNGETLSGAVQLSDMENALARVSK